jgi:hypothetical protein
MSFAAKYPGYCGICRLKIRRGDRVDWIAPVVLEGKERYNYEKQHPEQINVVTKLAHRDCLARMEGRLNDDV